MHMLKLAHVHMYDTLVFIIIERGECRLSYIIKLCGGGYTPIVKQAESMFQSFPTCVLY